ncbi:MAG: hypothetical protein JWR44_2746 [Hymenobacter sp.]|jgi:hypothetical protein|nr:hypothetical protein [Hymenobacter sp.]
MAQTATRTLAPLLRAIDEQRWLRHGLFWVASAAFMDWMFMHSIHMTSDWRVAVRNALLLQLSFMPPTYALLYGVLPALWQGQGRAVLLARLAVWGAVWYVLHYAFRYFVLIPWNADVTTEFHDLHNAFATGSVIPPMFTMGAAASLRVYRQWRQQGLANAQLVRENYQAELQLLKAQIHPHFLFNTLNNLYALTLRRADEAPEVVARLTGLLRFVVEQGDAPLVSLRAELNLLRNYLALERLRYGPRLHLNLEVDELPATGRIAPLLLLPLVENAFKHGSAEQVGLSRIHIRLAVAQGWFTCRITNTKNAGPAPAAAGIGLRNVRQRLALLYPGRHRLEVVESEHSFMVQLALQLPATAASGISPLARRRATQRARSHSHASLARPPHS